jgi:hypothetical protein
VAPSDIVEGRGLPGPVIDQAQEREKLLGMTERADIVGLAFGHKAERLVGAGLAGPVAELSAEPEAIGQVGAGLVAIAEQDAAVCEETAGGGLPGLVTEASCGGQCCALNGGIVVPMAAAVEEGRHGPGKLPGVGVESGLGGQGGSGEQDVVLGFEPGDGLLVADHVLGRDAGPGQGEGDRLTRRV